MSKDKELPYFRSCVDWDPADVHAEGGLCTLIDERHAITRRTFLQHVSRQDLAHLADALGYVPHPSQGLTMAADRHIEYFRSRHHGRLVYGFRHSAIEYVFRDPLPTIGDQEMSKDKDHRITNTGPSLLERFTSWLSGSRNHQVTPPENNQPNWTRVTDQVPPRPEPDEAEQIAAINRHVSAHVQDDVRVFIWRHTHGDQVEYSATVGRNWETSTRATQHSPKELQTAQRAGDRFLLEVVKDRSAPRDIGTALDVAKEHWAKLTQVVGEEVAIAQQHLLPVPAAELERKPRIEPSF